MKTEMRKTDDIRPYEQNPHQNDAAVDAVARSIREFGFRQPIVIDGKGVIVVGHTRWKAAKMLGLTEVPVHVARDLTPEQIKAYRLADNQVATLSEWNLDLLAVELGELQGMDMDLSLLGFSEDELAEILNPGGKDGLIDPDDVPEPPDEATTQPGDVWLLGDHRLLCGDSSVAEDVDRLLDGQQVHLMNTDPPYNVRVEPRSNNAIAAGLSSFGKPGLKHHQGFDVARDKGKAKATHKKMRAMTYSSKPGENVLDLFGGSGSTLIAAEQTGHRAFLMELDALYCDVIVQRWEKFTGRRAERISGRSNAPHIAEALVEGSK